MGNDLKGIEHFLIFGPCVVEIKLCVLCLFQLVIIITHFGVTKSNKYMDAPNPTWSRTQSRVEVLG